MSVMPRIRRASFDPDQVFRTDNPIPVIAGLRWIYGKHWGEPQDTEALAVVWTQTAVEIEWTWNGETFLDWIDAQDVRRR